MRKVFTIGETVLDIIFRNNQPVAAKAGGSVLNATVSLGRLGVPVHFISEYGNDQVGNFIDDFLNENHVNTQHVCRYSDGKSALALAFLDEQSNASYSFYKEYPAERLNKALPSVETNDIVLFGSFYGMAPELRNKLLPFLHQAKQQNSLLIYDPNFRKSHLHELEKLKPIILENMRLASIVRGSDEDFEFLFGTNQPEKIYEAVKPFCSNLIVTANKHGVWIFTKETQSRFEVPSIEPVSTVGAGDNFNAGLVYALLKLSIDNNNITAINSKQLEVIASIGTSFASHVCMSYDNYISNEFAKEFSEKFRTGN
jgi:fructokinase